MTDKYIYIMAHKDGQDSFIRIVPDVLEKLSDYLFDNNFTIGQCADWFWMQNIDHGKSYEILNETELGWFINNEK